MPGSATVGPLAVIEEDVELGEGVQIGPGCIVQRGARVGAETRLVSRVNLYAGRRDRRSAAWCMRGPSSGPTASASRSTSGTWVKMPQVGSVRIGDDVEIGANTTIDRGAIGDTVIGDGAKLDNQIQVGHNVNIGAHTAVAACTGISGSTTIGKRCMVGGMVGFAGHLTIADDVVITGCSLVSASIREPGSYSSGMPTVPTRAWRRMVAQIRRFGEKER